MSDFSLVKCPQFLDNAVTPPAKEIGETLANIFHVIFSPVNFNAEKLKLRQAENLKRYQEDIQAELNKIPEENLVEPPLNIVGPALEASKFYIEEDTIRSMFAKLIASSMDKKQINTQPYFVEIVKQMTALDASNLKVIALANVLPIAQYELLTKNNKGTIINNTNVFLSNPISTNNDSSISNLNRLGLISVMYDEYLTKDGAYALFENDKCYIDLCEIVEENKFNPNYNYGKAEIKKGTIRLTPLGVSFTNICI